MLELYSSRIGSDASRSAAPAPPYWVDLYQPTPDETAQVAKQFGVHVPSREQLQEIESSSRLRADGDVLYLSMPLTFQDDLAATGPVPLGFVISPRLLVTVRFSEVRAFAPVSARAKDGELPGGAQGALTALIEAMVDFGADALEHWSADLANLSRLVFANNGTRRRRAPRRSRSLSRLLSAVGTAGDHLSRIRETLLGLTRIVGYVPDKAHDWVLPEVRSRLQTAHGDLASLADFEAHLSGKTQFLLDAILGLINIEQNDSFKVLTIVSVVGVPPTLIASWYGMNFHNMPELSWPWGYEYGIAVIALSTIVPILWFKWRGWW